MDSEDDDLFAELPMSEDDVDQAADSGDSSDGKNDEEKVKEDPDDRRTILDLAAPAPLPSSATAPLRAGQPAAEHRQQTKHQQPQTPATLLQFSAGRQQYRLEALVDDPEDGNHFGLVVRLVVVDANRPADAVVAAARRCFFFRSRLSRRCDHLPGLSVCLLTDSTVAATAKNDECPEAAVVVELLPENLRRLLKLCGLEDEDKNFCVLCATVSGNIFCLMPEGRGCVDLSTSSPTTTSADGDGSRVGAARQVSCRLGQTDHIGLVYADSRVAWLTLNDSASVAEFRLTPTMLDASPLPSARRVTDAILTTWANAAAVLVVLLDDGSLRVASTAALGGGLTSPSVNPGLVDCRRIELVQGNADDKDDEESLKLTVQFGDSSRQSFSTRQLLAWIGDSDGSGTVETADDLKGLANRLNSGLDRLAALATADQAVTRSLAQISHLLRMRASGASAAANAFAVEMEILQSGGLGGFHYLRIRVAPRQRSASPPGPSRNWRCVLELRYPGSVQRLDFPLSAGEAHVPVQAAAVCASTIGCLGGQVLLRAALSLGLALPGLSPFHAASQVVLCEKNFGIIDFALKTNSVVSKSSMAEGPQQLSQQHQPPWTPLSLTQQLGCSLPLLSCPGHLPASVTVLLPRWPTSNPSTVLLAWPPHCEVKLLQTSSSSSSSSSSTAIATVCRASSNCLSALLVLLVATYSSMAETPAASSLRAGGPFTPEGLACDREALAALGQCLGILRQKPLPQATLAQVAMEIAQRFCGLPCVAAAMVDKN